MTTEQERTESRQRQAQGIEIAKADGVYKRRLRLCSTNVKDPQRRLAYKNIVEDLKKGVVIARTVKDCNVTRRTVYRVKKDSMVNHE